MCVFLPTIFVTDPACLGPLRQAPVPSTAKRGDAANAVKEAIDDYAEPNAAALAPRSCDMEALAQVLIPEPCPARVSQHLDEGHPLSNNRFQRDGFIYIHTHLPSPAILVVDPMRLGPRLRAVGASKVENGDADEDVKETIDDHAESTGCCLIRAIR